MKRQNETEQSQAKYISIRDGYRNIRKKKKRAVQPLILIVSQYKQIEYSPIQFTKQQYCLIMILLMSFLAVPPHIVHCEHPNTGTSITTSSSKSTKTVNGTVMPLPYDEFAEKTTNALIKNDSIINVVRQFNVPAEKYTNQSHDHLDTVPYSEANKLPNLLQNISDNKISQLSDSSWLVQHRNIDKVYDRLNEMKDNNGNEFLISIGNNLDNSKNIHKRTLNSTTLKHYDKENINENLGNTIDLPYIDADYQTHMNNTSLIHFVMDGLGLSKLPDMNKVNISQQEYATKYREYISRIQKRYELDFQSTDLNHIEYNFEPLHFVSIVTNGTQIKKQTRRSEHYRRTKRQSAIQLSNIAKRQQSFSSESKKSDKAKIPLQFPMNINVSRLHPNNIEEANVRLMMIHNPLLAFRSKKNKSKKKHNKLKCNRLSKSSGQSHIKLPHVLNIKIFHQQKHQKKTLLDAKRIEIERGKMDETFSKWLQFDVSKAVTFWLSDRPQTDLLELEIICDKCQRIGARILNDIYDEENSATFEDQNKQLMPVLNIIGRINNEQRMENHAHKVYNSLIPDFNKNKSSIPNEYYHNVVSSKPKMKNSERTASRYNCLKPNQRCCRHSLEVVFKEISGFEFIIQPKVFDAGYCQGRCPPRYNPANHHAMLQGLIWQQNRKQAPQPCCAPSKLVELEILHVDEKDSEKLKISTWTDMRVVECACS